MTFERSKHWRALSGPGPGSSPGVEGASFIELGPNRGKAGVAPARHSVCRLVAGGFAVGHGRGLQDQPVLHPMGLANSPAGALGTPCPRRVTCPKHVS